MSIQGFDHVAIPVQNVDAVVAFYRALGFVITESPPFFSAHCGDHKINFHPPVAWQSERFTLRAPAAMPGCGDFCFVTLRASPTTPRRGSYSLRNRWPSSKKALGMRRRAIDILPSQNALGVDGMALSSCPKCGETLSDLALSDRRCQCCGATLPAPSTEPSATAVEAAQPNAHVTDIGALPKYAESPSRLEPQWTDADIQRSSHGETLAVLSLLLPVIAEGVSLAWRSDSQAIPLALTWGTVPVTALLLAVDAGFLGTTDLTGTRRANPVALFFGIFLLWILFYPAAFFRRRHFGRPNLGPLSLLVAAFFVGAPIVNNFTRFGVITADVPTCTSREVVSMVDDMIRKSAMGPSVQSISGHKEISFDRTQQTRRGQCQVTTPDEIITATYRVSMLDRVAGTFQVDVDPILSESPPGCADPDVTVFLEQLIRAEPNGQQVKSVGLHTQTSYDRANKTRHGRCQVLMRDGDRNVTYRYRVYWVDQKTGRFQVEIEP
jgi:hypothetical protein